MVKRSSKKAVARKAATRKVAGSKAPAAGKTPAKKKAAAGKKTATRKVAAKKAVRKTARAAGTGMSSISISPEDRWKMIAIAAYHKAEARGFAPGGEVQDWLEAEREIDILITR